MLETRNWRNFWL